MNATCIAIQMKKLNGEKSEFRLLRHVHKYPGLNFYELGKKLNWVYGKVQATIGRLREKGLVVIKEETINGRNNCFVFESKVSFSDLDQYSLNIMKEYLKDIIEN